MVIGIIGGGASGMAAALAAAENPEVQVLLFERQARLGRKLQATGNGRCNLTNLHAMEGGYHGNEAEFVKSAMTAFNVEDTLDWFRDLGLFTVAEESGRVYPYSDQANSVVDVLRFALEKPNICVLTGFEVTKVLLWRTVSRLTFAINWSLPAAVLRAVSWAVPCPAINCWVSLDTGVPGFVPPWCRSKPAGVVWQD